MAVGKALALMWDRLARMLGVREDQAEDALKDETRAREAVQLSRRGFFAAGAVMAATPLLPEKTFSFLVAPPVLPPGLPPGLLLMATMAFAWGPRSLPGGAGASSLGRHVGPSK